MIEKTISTGLIQPGEAKTLRVEWGVTIPYDYIPWVDVTATSCMELDAFEQDQTGMTLTLSVNLSTVPVQGPITCRALTLQEAEAQEAKKGTNKCPQP